MQLKSIELQELPSNSVLYLKKWQSNGYFPLEKAVRTDGGWNVHWSKGRKWSTASFYYTSASFWYMLKTNHYLVSDKQMEDSTEFNFK